MLNVDNLKNVHKVPHITLNLSFSNSHYLHLGIFSSFDDFPA